MNETLFKITGVSLSPMTEIPENFLSIIDNSFVYSLYELELAKENNKILYIASQAKELIGYAIVTIAYPVEVAEDLAINNKHKVLWIDALEIINSHQGNHYGRDLVDYIRNSYPYDLLLLSTEKSIGFWTKMGFNRISVSGETAYMIFWRPFPSAPSSH